jgi:hypothetical protein
MRGLFYDALSMLDYIWWNEWMLSKHWIGKDWDEAVVVRSMHFPGILLEGLRTATRILSG